MHLKDRLVRGVRLGNWQLGRYPVYSSLPYHLKSVIRNLKIAGVVDVGAHEGEYAGMLRRDVGFQSWIYSFEPGTAAFKVLCSSMSHDDMWRGWQLALHSTNGVGDLHEYSETNFNSFLFPSHYGVTRFELKARRTEEVPIQRLDSFFDNVTLQGEPFLLKIDTQGADLAVLEGSRGILSRVAAIQVELSLKPIYEGVPTISTALELLAKMGYEPSGFFPVVRDSDRLRLIEVDCVLVRSC